MAEQIQLLFAPADGKPWVINYYGKRIRVTKWHAEGNVWVVDEWEEVEDD